MTRRLLKTTITTSTEIPIGTLYLREREKGEIQSVNPNDVFE